MKTFSHSGHLGDVLYALPTVKILSGGEATMIIKDVFEDHRGHINGNTGPESSNYTQYDAIKDLLLLQPYIKEVKRFHCPGDYGPGCWPGLKMDYDLDEARKQDGRTVKSYNFHVERYFLQFGLTKIRKDKMAYSRDEWREYIKRDGLRTGEDWRNHIPWLTIDEENKRTDNYAIFHITDRWHGFLPDWRTIYRTELLKYDRIYFTGYKSDYYKFEERYSTMMDYLPTGTLLDLARVVRDAQAVYCNQNCALVISQGLGKKYYLARNADRTHCHTNLKNEILL